VHQVGENHFVHLMRITNSRFRRLQGCTGFTG
jgi:hypothetical protein